MRAVFRLIPAFVLSLVAASAVVAQDKPDPKADLAAIRAKAEGEQQMAVMLEQLVELTRNNSGPAVDQQTEQMILGNFTPLRSRSALPANILAAENIPLAQKRAQLLSEIMTADLNDDWAITRAELAAVLSAHNTQRAAEIFISGDDDGDNVLSTAEIKATTAQMAEVEIGMRGAQVNLLSLFDFDDDGLFEVDELDRTIAALKSGVEAAD